MHNGKKISTLTGSILLVNCMLGTGIITIPTAFENLGIIGGIFSLFILTLFTFFSLYFLIFSSHKTGYQTYTQLCNQLGTKIGIFCNWIIVFQCYATSLSCFIFIIRFIREIINNIANREVLKHSVYDISLLSIIIIFPIIYISNFETLDRFKLLSKLVFISTFYIAIVFIYLYFTPPFGYKNKKEIKKFNHKISMGSSYFMFALECQTVVVSIYYCLDNNSIQNANLSMGIGCIFIFIVYFIIGFFGYLTLGSETMQKKNFLDIFMERDHDFIKILYQNNYNFKLFLIIVSIFCFIVILIGAFSVNSFVARQFLISGLCETENNENINFKKNIAIVSNIIHFSFLYIITVSKISPHKLLFLIGSSLCPLISFTFPSLIFFKYNEYNDIMKIVSILMFIGSIIIIVLFTYNAIVSFNINN